MSDRAKVFNIQRFSTHDGPGIRTVVFLKGCPLRCEWCSNPESQPLTASIFFHEDKCIGCGMCMKACPKNISVGMQGRDERCIHCGLCAKACPAQALELMGEEMTIPEIMAEIDSDASYYRNSGGGVTISGGEALMHPDFVCELADAVKEAGYHLALETTGFANWFIANRVFRKFDLLLYDIKHLDDEKHKQHTGVSNKLILENARLAAKAGYPMIFRVPLIGGVNDDEENITALRDFAQECGVKEVHFLPYHALGESKYRQLGGEYTCTAYRPEQEVIDKLAGILEAAGISVNVGG